MTVKVNYVDGIPTVSFTSERQHHVEPAEDRKYYENNTYIDWTSESTIVTSNVSVTSKKWLTLIVSALLVGYITTFIDLITVWLNDLKKGLCFSKIDKWSLLNPYLTCPTDDWYNWLKILFHTNSKLSAMVVNFPIYLLIALVLTIVASVLSIKYDALIKQSGLPEIKLIISGFNYDLNSYLGGRTLFFKTVSLILVVASGFWLGKEGPLVHVSCCFLNLMYRTFFNATEQHEGLKRELLSAAVATGISVAFNSPIGGVLFVLECIPCYFMPTKIMWNSFVSATIAVVVLTGFKIFTEGENFYEKDLFLVNFGNFSWLFMEIIPFIFLGCLGGCYGYLFTKFNLKLSSKHWKQAVHRKLSQLFKCSETTSRYLEIVLILILTTLLNFPMEITRLPLGAYLKLLFTDCPKVDPDSSEITNSSNFLCSTSNGITVLKLLYILIQGFFLSCYTYGLALPGGVLMPSLVLGATTGRLVGILSHLLQQKFNFDFLSTCTENSCLVSPSSYAVVGAGAYMAGITKLTMSVVVIIFELTGAVTYVLPIMLAAIALKFVNDKLCNENIYDSWLKTNFNLDEDYSKMYSATKNSDVNHGKGDGLCDFTNLTSSVKTQLPNVLVEKAMVTIEDTRCFSLFPEEEAHTAYNILSYMADDNHEGYPLISNKQNPISLGYVTKQELYSKLLGIENQHSPIGFQLEQPPDPVVAQQSQYEATLPADFTRVTINAEQPFIIINNYTPLVLVLEIFEKLGLNYLIVMNSDAKKNLLMSGFVDRFILSRLISSRFDSLQEYSEAQNRAADEFDIDNLMETDQLVDLRRERYSIELIT